MNQRSPFLFVCGVPRSGTTLLQRMLDHHPALCVTNDSHFIPRALEQTNKALITLAEAGQPIPLSDSLVEAAFNYHRFYRLGLSAADLDLIANRSQTYQQLVTQIYQAVADRAGKPLAGEKTPDYVRRAELLHGLFPSAKFIHIVRDGRDVALSLRDWATPNKGPGKLALWRDHPIGTAALWWASLIKEWQRQTRKIPANHWMVVRYEDLLSDPNSTLVEACQFLNIEYSPAMLQYHRGKRKLQSGLSAKKSWAQPKPGLRNWRQDLNPEEIGIFERLAGQQLASFGYEIVAQSDGLTSDLQAQPLESWWAENFQEFGSATSCSPDLSRQNDG